MAAKKSSDKHARLGGATEVLAEREAYHLEAAESCEHTADSYRRACVKDKAVHLTLQASWHKTEARELRKMIEALEGK